MLKQNKFFNYAHIDRIIFILTLLVCVFWYAGQYINVYRYAVTGAIFEVLSFPMLLLLGLLPVITGLIILKKKFSFKNLSFYAFLLLLVTILMLIAF